MNTEDPNHATSNNSPAETSQNELSGDIKLDDFSSTLADSKSAHDQSEPVSDHDQSGKAAGGPDAPSVPKKLNNKNALLHGVYSRDYILPWEVEADFETLHKEFKDEWKPRGRSEEEAVLQLTLYTWLKRRLVKSAQLRFYKCSLSAEMTGDESWEELIEFQKKVAKYGKIVVEKAWNLVQELNGHL